VGKRCLSTFSPTPPAIIFNRSGPFNFSSPIASPALAVSSASIHINESDSEYPSITLVNAASNGNGGTSVNANGNGIVNGNVTSPLPSLPAHTSALPVYPCEKSALARLFRNHSGPSAERSFFIKDVGIVQRQYKRFIKNLPNVRPFYAVKCNPDDMLLKVLHENGAGFDCASAAEINSCLAHGVKPNDIIFANPIKSPTDLRFAARVGVTKMTFDNEDELYKIRELCPNAELVIRLLPDDSGSVMRFGTKFGAPNHTIEPLLKTAQRLGLKIIGTSFHIGSGCYDTNMYMKAIELCRDVFNMAERLGLPAFKFLDLGGGFPGNPIEHERTGQTPAFEEFAQVIRAGLAKHFPASSGVTVIAEPGRYMATAYAKLFTRVQGKRAEPTELATDRKRKMLYYINDGVYGSFNCIMFDHAHPIPIPAYRFMNEKMSLDPSARMTSDRLSPAQYLSMNNSFTTPYEMEKEKKVIRMGTRSLHIDTRVRDNNCAATFFGPTCDSMDVIVKDFDLEELFVGDWVVFDQMGAYTMAAASTFNGMPKPLGYYCRSLQPSPLA